MPNITRLLLICLLSLGLIACASTTPTSSRLTSLRATSELEQGQRYFQEGYYRKALRILLPIACDGNPTAQYAVGYLYYYGYGVGQDTDTGYFWIDRAAKQGYQPAIVALRTMNAPEKLN